MSQTDDACTPILTHHTSVASLETLRNDGSPAFLNLNVIFCAADVYSLHVTFWATVCKTVRPILSDRCPVCLSYLAVTLVYCGQTVGQIKMKLGTQV